MYAKVFRQLWDGTLADPWQAWAVFVFLLAHADAQDNVNMTVERIAERAHLPVADVRAGLAVLEAPDPESQTPDHEGRRIVRLDAHRTWGWHIVNRAAYKRIRDESERRDYHAQYYRLHRSAGAVAAEEAGEPSTLSTPLNTSQPQAVGTEATEGTEGQRTLEAGADAEARPCPVAGPGPAKASQSRKGRNGAGRAAGLVEGGKSSEGGAESDRGAVVALLPTNRPGVEVEVREADVREYRALYPDVDVADHLRRMRGWLLSHPTRRKTVRGMAAFVNNWLATEQDRGKRTGTWTNVQTPNLRARGDADYLAQNSDALDGGAKGGSDK